MNLQSIVITNCIGIFLTVLVFYSSIVTRRNRDLESMLLTAMLFILGSSCLMEMLSFIVDGQPSEFARVMNWLTNTWLFLCNPAFAVLWLLYTDYQLHRKKKRLTTVYRPHLILLAVCWIAILGNLIGKYNFTVDENNLYCRQAGAYVLFAIPFLAVFNGIAEVVRSKRRLHIVFYPLWTFLTPFFIGTVLQILIYGVSLAWCCTAIGLAALYMSLQNQLLYRDALTGIYNRQYLDYVLHTWKGRSGIMIDMDYFKEINDNFGHSEGDDALRDTANLLKENAPENSIPIRFAGDEFILLLTTDREEEIREAENQIREAVDAFNRTGKRPYRISLSIGHAVYNQETSDRFLEAIDHAMYQEKLRRHETGQLADRRKLRQGTPGNPEDGTDREAEGAGQEEILATVRYDELTGLPNLSYFFRLCEAGKEQAVLVGERGSLLYMDLDGMKDYNQRYGFTEGDNLLKAFSAVLVRRFGRDHSCHIAGDRFAAFMEEEGLEDRLGTFFGDVRQLKNHLPVRIGIYSTTMEDVPVSTAFDRAKMACDTLPKSGESGYRYYNAELRSAIERRRYIRANIDRAVSEKWIRIHCQPIVRAVNGRVCDEEALARWIDPEEGLLSPAEFVPELEAAGLIYKLDLFVVEQVLEKIRAQEEAGIPVVPHSVNLSRADFDACDIVEEIRKRTDSAGVRRDLVTVEITESMIGSDFEFMKEQVARFRELGFPVWMDDFGSGYSSLDVLQSIRFDLIKFDMSFIRKLDEGESARIILTELMKMATSLGVDTICEGVETEDQARFLQEIGCSKLQGFYFSRPLPPEDIVRRYRSGMHIGFENPETSSYYETIGRINLYDLDMIAGLGGSSIHNSFNTMPMAIVEIRGDTARFTRFNPSYRAFILRFFGIDMSSTQPEFIRYQTPFMRNIVRRCGETGSRTFYDEKMPDGSVVHSFARRIAQNPATGEAAVAIAVLSVSEAEQGESYADIARALAADYYSIYVVDLDTDSFIEYSSADGGNDFSVERHGEDYFASTRREAETLIYEADREPFLACFTKENVIRELEEQGSFTVSYRLVIRDEPVQVSLRISPFREGKGRKLVAGIRQMHVRS